MPTRHVRRSWIRRVCVSAAIVAALGGCQTCPVSPGFCPDVVLGYRNLGPNDGAISWTLRGDKAAGVGEAPYPPNFPKMPGEPKRVQPSRAKKSED